MLGCKNKNKFFFFSCKVSNKFKKEGKVFIQINYLILGDSVILGRFTVPAFL
jgi:hypothetical protein